MEKNEKTLVDKLNEARAYWWDKLSAVTNETTFPYDEFTNFGTEKSNTSIVLDEELTQRLLAMSKNNDMALYVILTAVLEILLYKITGFRDVSVASSALDIGSEQLGGCILLGGCLSEEIAFKEFLFNTKEVISSVYKNQYYSPEKVIGQIFQDKQLSLFRTMLLLEGINHKDWVLDIIKSPMNDTAFVFKKEKSRLECDLWFNPQLYRAETIETILGCCINILKQIAGNSEILLGNIELVTPSQKNMIYSEFNNTKALFDENVTLHSLFEAQVEKNPHAVAISYTGENDEINYQSLTYRELNIKADCYALALREKGVRAGQVIAVMLKPSLELAAAILAVLKLGCAYLPIDPKLPEKRINYMLEDSAASLLITTGQLLKEDSKNLAADIFSVETVNTRSEIQFQSEGVSSDLAYVIYTSGSTGNPKGVMIEHVNIANYVQWRIKEYNLETDDISMLLISPSFDGFGADFYSSLLSGGKLIMVGDSHRKDFKHINRIVKDTGVTNFSIVPSVYKGMLLCDEQLLSSLRFVVLAGEKMNSELVELSNQKYPRICLNNEYGPTENSVTTTSYISITADRFKTIGKPIANNRVYIVNTRGALMPPGLKGELCIAGKGLSKGYVNNRELTAEKFVDDIMVAGKKMYKSGDMAKWLQDGNIEFLGRIDHQIKIRGLRIEPGEIECQLTKHPCISEAVVTDCILPDGSRTLCGYYVSEEGKSVSGLKEFLLKVLPDFMVPAYFIRLDEIPKLLSGKVDRNSLPVPEPERQEEVTESLSENSIEKKIAEVWKEILGRENIGPDDNFFQIGGDSLKAMQMSVIMEKHNLKIEVRDLFAHPKISELSKYVKWL